MTLDTELSGRSCRVMHLIGEGGQAEVWEADLDGQRLALKWFKPVQLERDPETRQRVASLIRIPAPSKSFLWPLDIVERSRLAGFGYLMPLLPAHVINLDQLVRGEGGELHPRLESRIAFNLATEFGRLHKLEGLAYRDINAFNVYFDVQTGAVRIIDNDNVSVNGRPSRMRGMPGFMAPELERDAGHQTSRYTDLHSLAVWFFRLVMRGDPFVGSFDLHPFANAAERRMALYGTHQLFVFHPTDLRNQPVPGRHDVMRTRWNYQPRFLRERFEDAFTTGLVHPTRRVTHGVWQQMMLRLHDAYFECTHCTAQHWYDAGEISARGGSAGSCWHCARPLTLPARLRITKAGAPPHVVMLAHGATLHPHHVQSRASPDFQRVIATFDENPARLTNLSVDTWFVRSATGERFELRNGDTLPFTTRCRVDTGSCYFETQPAQDVTGSP